MLTSRAIDNDPAERRRKIRYLSEQSEGERGKWMSVSSNRKGVEISTLAAWHSGGHHGAATLDCEPAAEETVPPNLSRETEGDDRSLENNTIRFVGPVTREGGARQTKAGLLFWLGERS